MSLAILFKSKILNSRVIISLFSFRSSSRCFLWITVWFALVSVTTVSIAAPVIVPGQVLKITVAGHPEFSQTVVIGQDGTVDYPLLSGVSLIGLSASEVRDLILPSIMQYEKEPNVYVVITQVQLIKAQIFGAVKVPGKYESESPLNLQQLIGMAGGVLEEADIASVRIIKSITQGCRTESIIDLTRHFYSDTLVITPDIQDGDVVVVPRLTPSTSVRVFGLVRNPGEVYIAANDNIYDIILRAGGFDKNADTKRVLLISGRERNYETRTLDINRYLKEGRISELPVPLGGDVLIVPELENWRNLNWWVVMLRDVVVLTSSVLILARL
jgi:protein involved in polysaccharide export with SLBB domain